MSSNVILTKAGLGLRRSGDSHDVLTVGPTTFRDPRGVIETAFSLATAQAFEGTTKGPYAMKFPSPFHTIGSKNLGMHGLTITQVADLSREIDDAVTQFLREYKGTEASAIVPGMAFEEHYRICAADGEELPDRLPTGFVQTEDGELVLDGLIPHDQLVEKVNEVKDADFILERRVQLVKAAVPVPVATDSVSRAVANYGLDQNRSENRSLTCPELYKKMSNNFIAKILKSIFPVTSEKISVKTLMEDFETHMDEHGFADDQALMHKATEGILLKWKGCLTVKDEIVDGVAVAMVSRKN